LAGALEDRGHAGLLSAVSQASDAIVITSTGGEILFVNPAFCDLTGYEERDVLGQNPRLLSSGQHPRAFYQIMWDTIRAGKTWFGEIMNRRKDGTLYLEDMRITPVRGSKGEIVSYIAIKRDVTAQQAAGRDKALLASIVESSDDAIVSGTPSNVILSWNRAAESLFGYTAEEAIGKPVSTFIPPDVVPVHAHYSAQVMQGSSVSQYESRCLTKDGRSVPVSVTGSPVFDDAGNVVALSAIIRDISAKKQAEEDQSLLSSIVQYSDDAIISVKIEGSIVSWNRGAEKLLGYTSEEILGENISILHDADAGEVAPAIFEKLRRGESIEAFDTFLLAKDGTAIDVSLSIFPIRDATGNPTGASGIARDIRPRLQVQRERQKTEERFRRIFEDSPFGMCITDVEGNLLEVNAALCEMFGYSANELLKTGLLSMTFPEDMDSSVRRIESLRANPVRPLEAIKRFVHRNGSVIWIELHISLFRDSNQHQANYVVQLKNLTADKLAEQALQESEERFRIMADGCPAAMWVTDAEGGTRFVNQHFRDQFSTTYEQMEGKGWQVVLHPDDAPDYLTAFSNAVQTHSSFMAETRVQIPDSGWIWVATYAQPRFSSNGEFLGHVGISPDITARKKAEERLKHSEEKFRQLAENINEVFWLFDPAINKVLYISPAYEQVWGRTCASLYEDSETWIEAIHAEDRDHAMQVFQRQMRGDKVESEYRIWKQDGHQRWIRDRAFPVKDASGKLVRVVGIAEDITERKAAEDEIESLAYYDPLTRLPNRRLLVDRLQQAIAACARNFNQGAVFFVDLDDFKVLNDTLGHGYGDLLLQEIARKLTASMRTGDTVARLGGDEFVVMAHGLRQNEAEATRQARALGTTVLQMLNQTYLLHGHEYRNTGSIGVTLFNEKKESVEDVLKRADLALYRAKSGGRGTMRFYDQEMQQAVTERSQLDADLRRALQEKQFVLYYQPQRKYDGTLVSVEALVRWQHPTRGLLPPSEFISYAEESGLIASLGYWVLEAACSQLKAWSLNPVTACLGMSVNISAYEFSRQDFVSSFLGLVDESRIDPSKLMLEITESAMLGSMEDTLERIHALKARGIQFFLDDFGMVYSSLSYLKNLPLDQLKIDRSFVCDLATNPHDVAIARTVIALGDSLGMGVIAEGVETIEQRDLLAGLGCELFQGYLFGRPVPISELAVGVRPSGPKTVFIRQPTAALIPEQSL
jgi:diguanylate cyclase (GGDEF)-like protein/PAS domain S-box-containing protein